MRVATAAKSKLKRDRIVAKKPARERLAELRKRAKLSVRDVAKALGYESPGGYHRYEREAQQGEDSIPLDIVRRLLPQMVGRGHPPITAEEMMALTDVETTFPRSVVSQYFSPDVQGAGGLPVRYSVEPGVYMREGSEARNGIGMVRAAVAYPAERQFVSLVKTEQGNWYKAGDQIHCVTESEFSPASRRGRRAVVAAPYKGGDLVEVVAAEVTDDNGLVGIDGSPLVGKVLGIVIGFYRQE